MHSHAAGFPCKPRRQFCNWLSVVLMQSIHSRILDADVWPHRTFLTGTPAVTPESRIIYCIGAAEVIMRTSFPTGVDGFKSHGISMKSIESAGFLTAASASIWGGKVHFFQIVLQRQPQIISSLRTASMLD
jgi:hypothetical protein